MNQALVFLVDTLGRLYILAFILRFLLQWVRADFHNPLSQAVVKITNPLVVPTRKIIPSIGGIDTATLIVMFVLHVLLYCAITFMMVGSLISVPLILLGASRALVLQVLQFYLIVIIVRVVLSWINPGTYNPVTSILYSLTEPMMNRVRRVIPPIGGLDLSPLFITIAVIFLIKLVASL